MKNILLSLIFFSVSLTTSFAQDADIVSGDLIVKLQKEVSVESFCRNFKQRKNGEIDLTPVRCLSRSVNIWLLHYPPKNLREDLVLNQVRNHEDVLIAQFNHTNIVTRVTTPNDTDFGSQWDMNNTGQSGGTPDADVDAPEAWDISTGGLTTQGDEIVVAVIDGGFDLTHPDLTPNYWVNTGEIAGNGVDDDGNGYIDDINGWDAYNNDGSIPSDNHGTHVAGTVGAKGNNGQGVAGVNWDVKIMAIAGASGNEATVVAAYGYVLDARTAYNNTGGAEGAFVVSTNASFGVDFGDPANFPLWCAMYDDLGMQGVLSAGATANQNIDVDVQGDVPTACSSDYMIAVTNTTDTDDKNTGAAFGATTIDLGAPGTSILSTTSGGGYGNLTGTSMATPHVAGAVALLVAAACDDFITNYKNDPATYALQLKDAIMNGADPISALSGITVTGGRLNLYNSIVELNPGMNGECSPDFSLSTATSDQGVCQPNDAVYTIDVASLIGFSDPVALSISGVPSGATANFSQNPVVPGNSSTLTISNTGMASTGTYILTITGTSTTPDKTLDLSLTLEDALPGAVTLVAPADAETGVFLSPNLTWNEAIGATSYMVEIATDAGFTNIFDTGTTENTFYTPSMELAVNTTYYWRVRPENACGDGNTSIIFSFTTQSAVYCDAAANDDDDEWIETIEVAGVVNNSGYNAGYGDYASIIIDLEQGETYSFSLTPAWSGTPFNEYWRIWIDYNHDGDFEDTDELVFDAGAASQNVETGTFTVPASTYLGLTRMRIIMRYNSAPDPCGTFTFGEVEDYSVRLLSDIDCQSDVLESGNYTSGTNFTITSSNYIHSNAVVESGANITYDATQTIELQEGFEVEQNGTFEAVIGGCAAVSGSSSNE